MSNVRVPSKAAPSLGRNARRTPLGCVWGAQGLKARSAKIAVALRPAKQRLQIPVGGGQCPRSGSAAEGIAQRSWILQSYRKLSGRKRVESAGQRSEFS